MSKFQFLQGFRADELLSFFSAMWAEQPHQGNEMLKSEHPCPIVDALRIDQTWKRVIYFLLQWRWNWVPVRLVWCVWGGCCCNGGASVFARKRMGGFAEWGILFLVVVSLGVGMIVHWDCGVCGVHWNEYWIFACCLNYSALMPCVRLLPLKQPISDKVECLRCLDDGSPGWGDAGGMGGGGWHQSSVTPAPVQRGLCAG